MILRTCYLAVLLYLCGFILLGASIQKHLSVGALIMGWGIAVFSVMIGTVAVYAYCNDCFPKHQVCIVFYNFSREIDQKIASRVK